MSTVLVPIPFVNPVALITAPPVDHHRAMTLAVKRMLYREYMATHAPRPEIHRWRERPTPRIITTDATV